MSDSPAEYPLIRTVGLDGLLVTFSPTMTDAANRAALAFHAEIKAQGWEEIIESACTLVSAFFRIDLVEHAPEALADRLRAAVAARDWFAAPLPAGRKLWTVPAVLGGPRAPQLDEAAEAAGIDTAQAKADLLSARLRVLTIGFAPGQPYLGHLPEHWNIPRLTSLTPNVPQGALVAAVRQICLFTKDTPTGWRHVGQSAFRTFRPDHEQPFPLSPGDELRFTEIEGAELARIEQTDPSGDGGATFEVLG